MGKDAFIDDLLGPMEPEPEDDVLIGQHDDKAGSETEPPEIEPMRVDENETLPPAATENDPKDLVVEPIQQDLPLVEKEPEEAAQEVSAELTDAVQPPVPIEKPSREDGLRKEIVRLRAELKRGEVGSAPIATQPAPPAPGVTPPSAPGAGTLPSIPGAQVVVSPDGSAVYLPEEEFRRRIAEGVQEAMQPSPLQQVAMANQQHDQQFIAANPEQNQPALKLYRDVDEYLGLKLAELTNGGYTPQSVPELTHTLKTLGVDQEFATFFPDTAPMFDEFIAATASQQPGWRRSILERMAAGMTPPTPPDGELPATPLVDVTSMPQSLAKKGGSRSKAPEADSAEFKTLEKGFHADPVGYPREKYNRYRELGKKLGEDGFESI